MVLQSHLFRIAAAVIILLITLVFGLDPKGYDFHNHVSRHPGSPGLHFDKYGFAYTDLSNKVREAISGTNGFSLVLTLKPKSFEQEGFNHIFSIYAGKDQNQLIVGQWYSHIIVMNGDDYDHRRKTARIEAEIPIGSAQPFFFAVTTGEMGTGLFIDGKEVSFDADLVLKIPAGAGPKLILANSVYGKHSWQGDIIGLAVYNKDLSVEDIALQYQALTEGKYAEAAGKETPVLLYFFDEKQGPRVFNYGDDDTQLLIPDSATPIKKIILARPLSGAGWHRNFLLDVILNLIGFIPLGFALAAVFADYGGYSEKRILLQTVLCCFTVSLTIEILQAWMPSRSSQSLDLILNTFGALIGAVVESVWET